MELKVNEKHKYETIRKVVENKITRKEAMAELKISRQQIYRLVKIYNEEGEKGFMHKNKGKISKKRIDKSIISKIEDLYLNEYYDYNFEHFYEQIKDRYAISYPSLHSYFLNDDIISPIAHKKTIKLYNKKMNKANS